MWFAEVLRTIEIEKHLPFVDDVMFANLDDDHVGPKRKDLVAFLLGSNELSHKNRTLTMFHLSFSCPEHVVLALPEVKLSHQGSLSEVGDGPGLSEHIRPVQS